MAHAMLMFWVMAINTLPPIPSLPTRKPTITTPPDRMALLELDVPAPAMDVCRFPGCTSTYAGPHTWHTVTQPAEPVASPVSTFDAPVAGTDAARELIATEDTVLMAHGIGDSTLLFDKGTALADVGHDNLAHYDAKYKALPYLADAMAGLESAIAAEQRRDTVADVRDYRVDVDGRLARKEHALGGKGVAIEHHALLQLSDGVGRNTNAGLAALKAPTMKRMRARTVHGDRSLFAACSDKYAVCDAPEALALFRDGLGDAGLVTSARAEVEYSANDTRWAIRAILQAPIDIPAFAGVGRAHQIFADLRGADNGSARISGRVGVMRIRCLNASLSQSNAFEFSRVHRGDAMDLRGLVARIPALFAPLAEEMRRVWAEAATAHYMSTDGGQLNAPDAIARLVAAEHLPKCGASEAEAVDRYVSAWREEECPHSAMGIVMAAQRAAHEGWSTQWAADEIETAASQLLYQHVNVLA